MARSRSLSIFCDSDSFFDFEFDQSEKYPSTPGTPGTLHTNDWEKCARVCARCARVSELMKNGGRSETLAHIA